MGHLFSYLISNDSATEIFSDSKIYVVQQDTQCGLNE